MSLNKEKKLWKSNKIMWSGWSYIGVILTRSADREFFLIFFKLKYSWFTVLCYFQVYSTVIQITVIQIIFFYRLLQILSIILCATQ